MANVIGRRREVEELTRRYNGAEAEFIAVYGRRRVGKTYLIKEMYGDEFAFHHTGLSPADNATAESATTDQLKSFYFSLVKYGLEGESQPKDWLEAFFLLEKLLERKADGKRQVVFIDEMPWMDTPRSGFIKGLENFWNGWANYHKSVFLIVCGSATSWITNKLVHAKGGLYGRLTDKIKLAPFSLSECAEFYRSRGIPMKSYDVVESYMALGGIPYYMDYFLPSMSAAQNIDNLFFVKNAKLENEFNQLFASIFSNPDDMKSIVSFLATRHAGFTREQIANGTGLPYGGMLSSYLKALEESDFITHYVPYGYSLRQRHYKLTDSFCWFWLHFKTGNNIEPGNYWLENQNLPAVASWRGIAFEEVCFNHIEKIKQALGIAGVAAKVSSYIAVGGNAKDGMQIDMIIDRSDRIINVCEMKFVRGDFSVDKAYSRIINSRIEEISSQTRKNVHSTLITTYGLNHNEYYSDFQKIITLDDII